MGGGGAWRKNAIFKKLPSVVPKTPFWGAKVASKTKLFLVLFVLQAIARKENNSDKEGEKAGGKKCERRGKKEGTRGGQRLGRGLEEWGKRRAGQDGRMEQRRGQGGPKRGKRKDKGG